MMKFSPITLNEIDMFSNVFPTIKTRTCDFTVGGMFMWRDYFSMEYCKSDVIYSRLYDRNGSMYYNIPLGADILEGISNLYKNLKDEGEGSVTFCTVPEEYLVLFDNMSVKVTEEQNFADYLYRAKDLISLAGRSYNRQRNQINHFIRENSDYSFEYLTQSKIRSVEDFLEKEFALCNWDSPSKKEEFKMTLEVVNNLTQYKYLHGMVLYVNGKVAGFSVGEKKRDTLYIHIEKASRNYHGCYQFLSNSFVKLFGTDEIQYVNREEDMGDAGLREAKMSYHPVTLLRKYTVEVDLK